MEKSFFNKKLLEWYKAHHRDLPWRNARDPYKIWLSEVILQQTRVNQGLPYYLKFVDNYPNVDDLANASEQNILRLWQGLGYYSRAKNLHKCAKYVKEYLNSSFPSTYSELLDLPGIGKYTAAAIASFAFKEPVAVVDGNVYRVLSRIFGMYDDISTNKGSKEFQKIANELLDAKEPDIYNQAIMEFGALQCVPKSPQCVSCPLPTMCYAYQNKVIGELPVKSKKLKIRKRYFHYLVMHHDNMIALKPRMGKDIWNGLYDFPLIELNNPEETSVVVDLIKQKLPEILNAELNVSEEYKHVLSHQHIITRFYQLKTDEKVVLNENKEAYYTVEEMAQLPKPVLINKYLTADIF